MIWSSFGRSLNTVCRFAEYFYDESLFIKSIKFCLSCYGCKGYVVLLVYSLRHELMLGLSVSRYNLRVFLCNQEQFIIVAEGQGLERLIFTC